MNSAKIEIVARFIWFAPLSDSKTWELPIQRLLNLDRAISIETIGHRKVPIEIRHLKKREDHEIYFSEFSPDSTDHVRVEHVSFSQIIEYDEKEALKYFDGMEITELNAIYLYEGQAESFLVKSIIDILLAANIAEPGCLNNRLLYSYISSDCYASIGYRKESYYLSHKGFGNDSLMYLIKDRKKESWPPINALDFLEVYKWLEQLDGFEFGTPSTRLGRAYSAYSYLMGDLGENSNSSLMWVVMALEALYCKGNAGLKEQLNSKSEVFLGPRDKLKKEFAQMYDYRSRLIHGDINFVFRHHIYDGSNEAEKFRIEFSESEEISMLVLFSTFQKMCKLNIHTLEFKYEVSNS